MFTTFIFELLNLINYKEIAMANKYLASKLNVVIAIALLVFFIFVFLSGIYVFGGFDSVFFSTLFMAYFDMLEAANCVVWLILLLFDFVFLKLLYKK